MRRIGFWAVIIWAALSVPAATFQAASHLNALEPATKTELKIPTDTIVGACLLKAGTYIVTCDRETVTFRAKDTNELLASLPCEGPLMKEKAKETRAVYEPQPSGYAALEKLYLKGNNVEHIF